MCPLPEVKDGSQEPLYNIGVVARMTGVAMATLRAWERRYEFPESERTAGGHRLYSEGAVMRVRWVKERIAEGMQTAQAIHALRHQESTGRLLHFEQEVVRVAEELPQTKVHLRTYFHQLVEALTRRDLLAADHVLGEALAAASPDDLILDVISPAIAYFGAAWESGQTSVADEHLATNYLRQRLMMWMMSGPPPRATPPIMLACAPEEWHEGSLLVLGALLRRLRWPVAYLGQSVPLDELAKLVRELNPQMIVLVAMTENSAARLMDWPTYLSEAARIGRPIVAFGGRVFTRQPEWRERVKGNYLGSDFREGLHMIERLLA